MANELYCDNFIMSEDGENFEMTQTTKGEPGEGVPTGGTTGQVLKKASDDDYDTEWADNDAGDVGYDSEETYQSGTVGKTLNDLSQQTSDLEDAVTDETTGLDSKAPVILETVSGAIASFDDGADGMPVKKLVANIEPVQDLHGYSNPWPAGGGKNQFSSIVYLSNRTIDDDGTIISNNSYDVYKINFSSGTYTISFSDSNTTASKSVRIGYYQSDDSFIELYRYEYISGANVVASFSVPAGTAYLLIALRKTTSNVQLELGSTATDYAPYSNICPISGHTGASVTRTGKNLLKIDETEMVQQGWNEWFPLTIKAGTYTMSCQNRPLISGAERSTQVRLTDLNKTPIINISNSYAYGSDAKMSFSFSITEEQSRNVAGIVFEPVGGAFVFSSLDNMKNMLELGSTATDYEPYTGNQISVDWETEAGTVYGGTLTINPDRTGTLVVDSSVETWDGSAMTWQTNGGGRARIVAKSMPNTRINNNHQRCSFAKYATSGVGANADVPTFQCIPNSQYIVFGVPGIDTEAKMTSLISEMIGAGNPLQFYSEIEPVTYQLTDSEISGILSTLYGTNNIWADTGDVTVEYPADTKLYIEQLTKPTEDDMTADHAISAGTFFMIGNSLYLATSQIAAGGTITPGTNATQLSLADALNQLNT